MINHKISWKLGGSAVLLAVLCLIVVPLIAAKTYAAPGMPSSGEKQNMKLVGYNDLQGRESLQVTTKGNWVYVGHHPGLHYNPITEEDEWNGTTVIDISDPTNPVITAHIKNDVRTNSRSPSVVYGFGPAGRDYLIRNHEEAVDMFEIFDITDRFNPLWLGAITGTPVGSCESFEGEPCGGLLSTAHKGWWSSVTGLYYATGTEPGFRSQHLMVWDLSNFEPGMMNLNDTFVGRAWLPGQKDGEPDMGKLSWHHPIVDEARQRVYGAYLTGGDVLSVSTKDPPEGPNMQFPVKWHIDTDPPGSGTHTVTVIQYDDVPNFEADALPRLYALVADEATGGDMWRFTDTPPGVRDPVRDRVYIFDVTDADETGVPFPIETWQVPNDDYLMRGGRFGPHQFNETIDGEFNLFVNKIAYIPYFNAGVRAIDISNPHNIVEVGYYVPQENERTGYIGGDQPSPNIQINDVDVDYRGLIYASDRVGSGLFVLEYTKKKKVH